MQTTCCADFYAYICCIFDISTDIHDNISNRNISIISKISVVVIDFNVGDGTLL